MADGLSILFEKMRIGPCGVDSWENSASWLISMYCGKARQLDFGPID
jgi:hypothetical protein